MTPAGLPPGPLLPAWHRRFPDRSHLWVGTLRLWRSELPVRPAGSDSRLRQWIAKASASGEAGAADVARRLGLPEAVVAAATRLVRRPFAFLDLAAGPVAVPIPAGRLPAWPEPVSPEDVPPAVLRPPGVGVVPASADWRSVPVVGAEGINAVAVGRADGIEIYAAGPDWALGDSPTWRLPADAIPAARPEDWTAAWEDWCRGHGVAGGAVIRVENGLARVRGAEITAEAWLIAGRGPLKEAALVHG
jgi:hypothetical protein